MPTDDVAFVKNTTEGLGFVANGLTWAEGDRVLVPDLELLVEALLVHHRAARLQLLDVLLLQLPHQLAVVLLGLVQGLLQQSIARLHVTHLLFQYF